MDSDDDTDPFFEVGSASSDEDVEDLTFDDILQRIKENNPVVMELCENGSSEEIQNMTDEEWDELGRDVANNTHLQNVYLNEGALSDHKMSFFFRGLTRSNSIENMNLNRNGITVVGIRSMVPFLQNANNLKQLYLDNNNIHSEGFNLLLRALSSSPIKELRCRRCGIESVEIDRNNIPQNLILLNLCGNNINTDGCRGLAWLLHGRNSTVTDLWLGNNNIDDEGVAILVDTLQNNSSLKYLDLEENDDISNQGKIMLLQLVNDTSSIKATLQSNHTLRYLKVKDINPHQDGLLEVDDEIQDHIDMATEINMRNNYNPESVGREKIIQTQLHSKTRAVLAALQGIYHSAYSEIDPLHLPEVFSLIGRRHGQGELYVALLSSVMTLFSTMNREKCIQQLREHHAAKIAEYRAKAAEHTAKIEELDAELATMKEAAERNQDEMDFQSNKRRRT